MKSIATDYMPEVVSDLSYDFKKMLEYINTIPVIMGILVRVIFLGTDNS
jgi:hypothetical protein